MKIIAPVGCQATVYVPVMKAKTVTESGKPIEKAEEITFVQDKDNYRIFKVKSGEYKFASN